MKLTKFANIIILGTVIAVAGTACKKRPTPVTAIPGSRAGGVQVPGPGNPLAGRSGTGLEGAAPLSSNTPGSDGANGSRSSNFNPNEAVPLGNEPGHPGWPGNAEILRDYMVFFDFDSSAVTGSEQSKIASVADYLRANASHALRVEGHCDERGTEEYNRALGERRALAIREELIRLGIDSIRVDTISYGKDRPLDPAHNDDAWRKNRRGEFIVLTPPNAAP